MTRPAVASEEYFRLNKAANGDIERATISNPCDSAYVEPDITCEYTQPASGTDVGKLQPGQQWIKTITYATEDVAQLTYASKQDMCNDSFQQNFQRLWFCEYSTPTNNPLGGPYYYSSS